MSRQQDSAVDPFITVSEHDFDPGAELARFNQPPTGSSDSEIGAPEIGAITSFIGIMRPTGQFQAQKQAASPLKALRLEHYPGMTERILSDMRIQAVERFQLQAARIIHRVGMIYPGEHIVFVATASRHRQMAFSGCQFLIDWLKTDAPFWKEEISSDGTSWWVEARASDEKEKQKWSLPS